MDSTDSKETITYPGSNSNRPTGPTSEAASYVAPSYRLLIVDEKVFLSPSPLAAWDVEFIPIKFTLPYRYIPSAPVRKCLIVHDPIISSTDFFNFASQFGPIYKAQWTPGCASVVYVSEEHTDRCFDELIKKGHLAAITAVSAPHGRGNVSD